MKKVVKGLILSMGMLFFMALGLGNEDGFPETASEILQKCSCGYEHQQVIEDQKLGRSLLLATLMCHCEKLDIKMVVVCGIKGKNRPTASKCARDNSISWAKSAENEWPADWPAVKEEKASGIIH